MMTFHRRAKCRYWACRWPLTGQAIRFPAIAEAHAPAIIDDIVGLARVAVVDGERVSVGRAPRLACAGGRAGASG